MLKWIQVLLTILLNLVLFITPYGARAEQSSYIVVLEEPPAALYRGGVNGLAATSPMATGARRMAVASPAVAAYRTHLAQARGRFRQNFASAMGRAAEPRAVFDLVLNGMVLRLSKAEAEQAASLPGVKEVVPDQVMTLDTDAGPTWIGAADIWDGTYGATASLGEGVVVGIIDSGINPSNPSFNATGPVDSYVHSNPWGEYKGACDENDTLFYLASFNCNDKLIAAYNMLYTVGDTSKDPTDVDGHGSHTASTATGNKVNASLYSPSDSSTPILTTTISGVAPHANIVAYRVCDSGGSCYTSSAIAAVEEAIATGVDVLNYSISGPDTNPWDNTLFYQCFLAARSAGTVVVTTAGNDGPDAGTIPLTKYAPWVITVGAATHDRRLNNTLSGLSSDSTGLADTQGRGVTVAHGDSENPKPLVYAGDYGDSLCFNEFSAGTWTNGEIVVCDRGSNGRTEKGYNVLAGGAGGMILANDESNGDSLNADLHYLPAVHISYDDGVDLLAWMAGVSNPRGYISGVSVDQDDSYADIMASFSSRGPHDSIHVVIKPDLSAPGVDIVAADGTGDEVSYGTLSGTSMASPHVAGAATLLVALHPDWTPAEIQSALMTTCQTSLTKEDGVTDADPWDTGAGRVRVDQAALAGFVMDISEAQYTAANPDDGGDPSALNLPSLSAVTGKLYLTWTRTLKSTQGSSLGWTVTFSDMNGVTISADPDQFTLDAGGSQTVNFTADLRAAPLDTWIYGRAILTPSDGSVPTATMPIALLRTEACNVTIIKLLLD